MMGDPMVLLESETVELKMSARMMCRNCAYCAKIGHIVQKQECVGSGNKEKFLYRNHEITQDYTRLTQKRENGRYE